MHFEALEGLKPSSQQVDFENHCIIAVAAWSHSAYSKVQFPAVLHLDADLKCALMSKVLCAYVQGLLATHQC